MTWDEILRSCKDPVVKSVRAHDFALQLLARGLRPKQVAIIAGVSQWKVNELRRGLMPDDRLARPPMSATTILRRPWLRAAASLFMVIHRRVVDSRDTADDRWTLFLRGYDVYESIAQSFRERWPVLAIEDAFTIYMALDASLIASNLCDHHDTHFLIVPGHDRAWGCPYCTLEAGEWSLTSHTDVEICARTVQQSLDRAGAGVCDHPRYTGPIETEDQP